MVQVSPSGELLDTKISCTYHEIFNRRPMESLTVLISHSSVLNRQMPSYASSRRWQRSHMSTSLLREDAQPTASRDSMHGLRLKYCGKRVDLHHNHYKCKTNMAICHKVINSILICTYLDSKTFRILFQFGKFSASGKWAWISFNL